MRIAQEYFGVYTHFWSCDMMSKSDKYILLHDREGDMGKYSAQGWQYWPEHSEGQYRTRELNISPYCGVK